MQVAVERRPTLLFLIVLAALLVVMSWSKKTRVLGETRTLFERSVMTVFSPVPKAVNLLGQNTQDMYHGYLDMRRSVAENLNLHRQVAELTKENLMLRRSYGDLSRMRSILGYSEEFSTPVVLAQVVLLDTTGRFKSIILDQGSDAGIEVNDPVVHPGGLIGRVVLTTKDLAKVQLVIDTNSSVGALIERTRRQGIVRGDGRGALQMGFIPSLADVVTGDKILTAGIDGIYPKGIPVATVFKSMEGKDLFKTIELRPTADFTSLEEVMVLRTQKIPSQVVGYQP